MAGQQTRPISGRSPSLSSVELTPVSRKGSTKTGGDDESEHVSGDKTPQVCAERANGEHKDLFRGEHAYLKEAYIDNRSEGTGRRHSRSSRKLSDSHLFLSCCHKPKS